ncbi:S-layer family protein [Acinetobacter sp. 5862]|uniref:beta strand repeat-containing protein n=1 Tax=Acinetobacter sp. 5862 TaxID=2967169 RepID=UPI0021126CE1|nr:hypothetical protein [Acinetobacter sp. 5862]
MRYCVALWVLIATCLINQSIFAVTFDSTPPTARFEVTGTTQSPIVRGGSGTQVITVQNKGPDNATNTVATVNASLSTGVTIASVTSSVGSCSGSGSGPYTCSIGSVANAGTFTLSITYNVSLAASVGTAQQIAVSVNSNQYNPGSGAGEMLHNAWGAIGAETTASQYGAFWVGRTSTTATCNTKSSPCFLGSASEEGDALLSAWPKDQVNPTGQYLNSAATGNNNDTYFTSGTTNPTVSQVVPNISTYAYKSLVLGQGSNFVNNRRAWQFSSYVYIPASTTSVSLCVGTSGAMIDDGAYITLKKSTDSTRTVVQSPRDSYDRANAYVVTTTGLSSGYYELVYRMVNQNNVSSGEHAPGQYGAVGMSFNGGACTDANLQNALTAGFPAYISIVNPDSDLAITKTNNTSLAVGGTSTDYIVRVTNNGPDAAVGAILKDAAVASLTKTAIACNTIASNKCTSGTTPTITAIESGSGYTLPTLANGEFYELKITATVANTSTLTSVSNTATVTAPANTTDSVSTNNSATDTDSIRARIRIAKISNNGFGSFDFTGLTNLQDSSGNSVTTDTVTTTASGSAVTSSNSLYSSNLNNAVLISETIPANYNLSSASCIDSNAANSGNPATAFGTLSSGQLTIPAANIVAGANIVCTFTNNRKSATFRISKAWGANSISGNVAQIAATTGLTNNTSALTSTAPTNVNGSSVTVYAGETVTLPAETMTTGNINNYNTVLSCSAGGGATANSLSGTNGQSSNSLTVGAGDESKLITCTYTNTRKSATLTLRKTWTNAKLNDAATVSATGLTSLSSTADTANETDAGTAQTVYAGDVITLSETITTGAGNYTAGLACTGNTTALSGSQLTVNALDSSVVCTYTNSRKSATLTLRKTWTNAKIADSVTVNSAGFINNASVSSVVTTSGNDTATSTVVTVYAGEIGTIVENFIVGNPTDYNSSLACSGTTGLVGNSLTINGGDTNILCVYTNSRVTQVIISGKVFNDNSGTTNNIANAYNGIQDNGELGIANSLILLNDCSSTQVAAMKTNAEGEYSFSVNQNSLPASFCIVQQNLPEYISVSGTTGYTRSSDTIALTKTSATSYTANNFGDVIVNVVLHEDGQHTAIAGDVTDYPHRLSTQIPVQLTQLLQTQTQQPNASADQPWQALVYRDTNCNGQVDMGEVVFNPTAASTVLLQPSVDICLVQRVHVPTNVTAGAQHIGTLQASYQFALTNPAQTILGQTLKRQDVTLIGSAGLTLTKKVRAVASCPSPSSDTNAFVTTNQAAKQDNLEYEITYKNNSTKKLQNVKVKDSLPIGTNFGSMSCRLIPSGNTCNTNRSGDYLEWSLTGLLNPSASGTLRFCVSQK